MNYCSGDEKILKKLLSGTNTYFYNTNTSGTRYSTMEWYSNGTVYANDYLTGGNSLRAPIFYDSGDTGYYVNANGTARLNYVVANGGIRVDANEHIYLDYNYGQTIFGVYTSTRYQGIFAMGTSYRLPVDGTSSGNLYGLSWSHPNAGGQASYLNTHGLLVMENGTTNAAIASVIWARADMRSPILYDHDTGYYFNGNGTTNYLPKWTGTTGLGNSQIRDDGTNVGIGGLIASQNFVTIFDTTTATTTSLNVINAANALKRTISASGGQTGVFSIVYSNSEFMQ
jgi:hypothetical protein